MHKAEKVSAVESLSVTVQSGKWLHRWQKNWEGKWDDEAMQHLTTAGSHSHLHTWIDDGEEVVSLEPEVETFLWEVWSQSKVPGESGTIKERSVLLLLEPRKKLMAVKSNTQCKEKGREIPWFFPFQSSTSSSLWWISLQTSEAIASGICNSLQFRGV